jgi:3-oxoacyl-(acyl-carrier-protein) synthase
LGEGGAILVMETMDNAVSRNAVILAELVGYGASADAHHITQPAPEGEGGARAMLAALQQATLQPDEIDYINAHGTSTPMNDKFETMAMKSVFDEQAYKIPISSTKSMTGHLLGASGAIEAAVSVQVISKSAIPPTINLESPDPDCDLNYTPNASVNKAIDTAMSNSFGFGGHNSSLIFQKVE